MIKKYISKLVIVALFFTLFSCEEYLDKTESAGINDEEVFTTYNHFQGFVDQLYYSLVPYVGKNNGTMDMGDDVIATNNLQAPTHSAVGDYLYFLNTGYGNLYKSGGGSSPGGVDERGIWDIGWTNIRNANIALEKIPLLIEATDEEKNLLLGQIYFFRAWCYFEIARAWGGVPYLETALDPNDNMNLPRLSMEETFLKIADDFKKAAEYLPWDWNETAQGIAAPNKLNGRITKGAAYAMQARTMLYVASPWVKGLKDKNPDYPDYNKDYLKVAAEAAMKVIKSNRYTLLPWEQYQWNFARNDNDGGANLINSNEMILYQSLRTMAGETWRKGVVGRIHTSGHMGGQGVISPTLEIVNMFETQNGLDIKDDPTYSAQKPWANRDPRFRVCILTDGVKWIAKTNPSVDPFVQLYSEGGSDATGTGLDREPHVASSMTGFLIRKLMCYKTNLEDKVITNYRVTIPFIRLAEMYLTYAEAMNEIGGPYAALEGESLTAVDAINILRRRIKLPVKEDMTKPYEIEVYGTKTLPDVNAKYLGSKEVFRDRIRAERTVELAFEGHRFHDIRRWNIAHKLPKESKGLYFAKGQTNFREFVAVKRVFEYPKHYLFPFRKGDTYLYEGFKQNPGWE